MISLLLCDDNIERASARISTIIALCKNPGAIEFIVGVDTADKLELLQNRIKEYKSRVNILCKNYGQFTVKDDLHHIFNFCYRYASADSHIFIPLENSAQEFSQDWDINIIKRYQEYKHKLGHDALFFRVNDCSVYSDTWLDITGGFGLIRDMVQWATLIIEAMKEPYKSQFLQLNDFKKADALPAEMTLQVVAALAGSITRHVDRIKRKDELSAILDKMDVFATTSYIADQYSARKEAFAIPLIKYFCEASSYVLRNYTLSLLRVMSSKAYMGEPSGAWHMQGMAKK